MTRESLPSLLPEQLKSEFICYVANNVVVQFEQELDKPENKIQIENYFNNGELLQSKLLTLIFRDNNLILTMCRENESTLDFSCALDCFLENEKAKQANYFSKPKKLLTILELNDPGFIKFCDLIYGVMENSLLNALENKPDLDLNNSSNINDKIKLMFRDSFASKLALLNQLLNIKVVS
jgi:hypothetical protein